MKPLVRMREVILVPDEVFDALWERFTLLLRRAPDTIMLSLLADLPRELRIPEWRR